MMNKNQKGFSLIALLIVVADYRHYPAAIAIPNLLSSRRAANEGSAQQSLRTMSSAEATFHCKLHAGAGSYGPCLIWWPRASSTPSSVADEEWLQLHNRQRRPCGFHDRVTIGATPVNTSGVTGDWKRAIFALDQTGVLKSKPGRQRRCPHGLHRGRFVAIGN